MLFCNFAPVTKKVVSALSVWLLFICNSEIEPDVSLKKKDKRKIAKSNFFEFFFLKRVNNTFLDGLRLFKCKSTKFENMSSVFPYFQWFCCCVLWKKGRNEKPILRYCFFSAFALCKWVSDAPCYIFSLWFLIILANYIKKKIKSEPHLN